MDAIAPLLAATINAGTPLLLAALGLLINEKSGVINLGSEGMMLMAAIVGFAVAVQTGSPALGFVLGAVVGMVMAAAFAWLTVWLGANQVACGLALSLFGVGASAYIGLPFTGNSLVVTKLSIPVLKDIPLIGPAFFPAALHGLCVLGAVYCRGLVPDSYPLRSGAARGG